MRAVCMCVMCVCVAILRCVRLNTAADLHASCAHNIFYDTSPAGCPAASCSTLYRVLSTELHNTELSM